MREGRMKMKQGRSGQKRRSEENEKGGEKEKEREREREDLRNSLKLWQSAVAVNSGAVFNCVAKATSPSLGS